MMGQQPWIGTGWAIVANELERAERVLALV